MFSSFETNYSDDQTVAIFCGSGHSQQKAAYAVTHRVLVHHFAVTSFWNILDVVKPMDVSLIVSNEMKLLMFYFDFRICLNKCPNTGKDLSSQRSYF